MKKLKRIGNLYQKEYKKVYFLIIYEYYYKAFIMNDC